MVQGCWWMLVYTAPVLPASWLLLCGGCYSLVLEQTFIQFLNDLVKTIEPAEYYFLLLFLPLCPQFLWVLSWRFSILNLFTAESDEQRSWYNAGGRALEMDITAAALDILMPALMELYHKPEKNSLPPPASWTNSPCSCTGWANESGKGRQAGIHGFRGWEAGPPFLAASDWHSCNTKLLKVYWRIWKSDSVLHHLICAHKYFLITCCNSYLHYKIICEAE